MSRGRAIPGMPDMMPAGPGGWIANSAPACASHRPRHAYDGVNGYVPQHHGRLATPPAAGEPERRGREGQDPSADQGPPHASPGPLPAGPTAEHRLDAAGLEPPFRRLMVLSEQNMTARTVAHAYPATSGRRIRARWRTSGSA